MSKITQLQEIIDSSDNIVFFGGAGVSTESGIPDFRSESGIFKSLEKYGDTPENLVSHSYYLDHTVFLFADKHIKVFFSFYHNTPRQILLRAYAFFSNHYSVFATGNQPLIYRPSFCR